MVLILFMYLLACASARVGSRPALPNASESPDEEQSDKTANDGARDQECKIRFDAEGLKDDHDG